MISCIIYANRVPAGIHIHIAPESVFTISRNAYSHAPEYAPTLPTRPKLALQAMLNQPVEVGHIHSAGAGRSSMAGITLVTLLPSNGLVASKAHRYSKRGVVVTDANRTSCDLSLQLLTKGNVAV